MMGPLLEVKDLSVTYRQSGLVVKAVSGVSFSLQPGEILGIAGESGAGKSSLALVLMGLLDRSRVEAGGEAWFDGHNLLALDEQGFCRLRGSGLTMIFQHPAAALDPGVDVVKQVATVLRRHRRLTAAAARDESRRRLMELGFEESLLQRERYAHQLSGGLCQRAMIAAALACGPRLLIADEPTSALDLTTQAQLVQLLTAACRQGLTLIFISHNLPLLARIADQLMVMRTGSAVEVGPCRQVLSRPVHSYTQELVDLWSHYRLREDELAPA